jgi:ADP-ribosylglycohydrolase
MTTLPNDYLERVYAGVLGKLIGVYLGRPFEGWTYEKIMEQLGEITGYVHERLNKPLIVTDDDISGTFTFLRALPDYGNRRDLTAAQIGQTWLNYLIERRTILWWGGKGNSTEHTAYMRLKQGIPAPDSGSIATNGKIVAEQIGAQIFIDGWAMVAPGDPALAADLARRAASVSHDGEAIYGAQVIAVMESLAFVESDLNKLLDAALTFIPADSTIARMIGDIRGWHKQEPDWRKARALLEAHYGYDKYGGVCHMVPNHGLIILSLLYGEDDFNKSLMIVNTSGWDTDCNSGNVGCLLGIKNGLATLEGKVDWRGPVADRMYISSADGGRSITDATLESIHIVNAGRQLAGLAPEYPKQGARFHFDLPGSVQGFLSSADSVKLENVAGHSALGSRSLALHCQDVSAPVIVATLTGAPADIGAPPPYDMAVSPTLYPSQTIRAVLSADSGNGQPISARLVVSAYDAHDQPITRTGPAFSAAPGATVETSWTVDSDLISPIVRVGLQLDAPAAGTIYLDTLTWDGMPTLTLKRPARNSVRWREAWVSAMDHFDPFWYESFRVAHNSGRGMVSQGTREWRDYQVSADLIPHMIDAGGLGIRVQGMRRYYALLITRGRKIQLVKMLDSESVLAEADFAWNEEETISLRVSAEGNRLRAWANGKLVFDVQDTDNPLLEGAAALFCQDGSLSTDEVRIEPAP